MRDIVKILKNKGIGVLPTDTLYGIVGSAYSKEAVERIYKVRGRSPEKPCIILISSISDLKKFGISTGLIRANRLMLKKVWSGPVSIILHCTSTVMKKKLKYLHRGKNSLAFRFPKNKSLLALLKKTGPLIAPSANPEGKAPAETVAEAKKYFGDSVDFYVSGGRKTGKPSKIISINVKGEITVLRK